MLSLNVFAQHEVGSLTLQPRVGLNIANFTNSDGANPRLGLAAGGEFEYQIARMFSVSGGMLYSMQGATDKESGVSVAVKTDYINIPVLANIYVFQGLAIKFGLQPGFNISSKYKISGSGMSLSGSLSDLGDDVKSFDFAIPVGLSYEFNNVVIDGRYNIGVTRIMDGDSSKNSVFQITVGYKFEL